MSIRPGDAVMPLPSGVLLVIPREIRELPPRTKAPSCCLACKQVRPPDGCAHPGGPCLGMRMRAVKEGEQS